MKKIISLICAAGLVLCFAACTKKAEDETITPDNAQTETESTVTEDKEQNDSTEPEKAPEVSEETEVTEEKTEEKTEEQKDTTEEKEEPAKQEEKKEEEIPKIPENLPFDASGKHFEGLWVNDSGTTAVAEINRTSSDLFQVIARIYKSSDEYLQYEAEAYHAISTDGSSGLIVTSYEWFNVLEIGDGTIEISKNISTVEDMIFVYDNSSQAEYMVWFYSEDDSGIITFIPTASYEVDILAVEEMRN